MHRHTYYQIYPTSVRRLLCSLGLAERFYGFLSLEHPNNNVHNLRLCRLLVARGSQPAARLLYEGVTAKVPPMTLATVDERHSCSSFCQSVLRPRRLSCLLRAHCDERTMMPATECGSFHTDPQAVTSEMYSCQGFRSGVAGGGDVAVRACQ